ncbi:SAM-dependent methyltransferase [Desulfatiglans anilini]|uniref:SAM-dependent methyltransferase n=1 Tax=Desulfatiglans anilini TaxID=90728 RepID=UPI000404CA2B|nr:RlmE family RNA methyltransferase [Desulfatiglans anilini]
MQKNTWDDHYARRAREENWLARSVYKLQEIDRRFKIIRKGNRILDLGCYPGSWSQYALRTAGPQGHVAGIDLKKPERLSALKFQFIQADIFSIDIQTLQQNLGPRDVVLSDLAPQTTGAPATDTSRSLALSEQALKIAEAVLERSGRFVCKLFEGGEIKDFQASVADRFERVRLFRPQATRKRSREIYLIGMGFT